MSDGDIMISYESICNKLGFDILKDGIPKLEYDPETVHEDDSKPSRWSVLTYEELKWLDDNIMIDYLKNNN